MSFRKTIFWLHLACGVTAGLAIGIMCLTGTILAFEKELAAWGERDARRVDVPPANASRISIEDAQRKLRATFPDARPMNLVVTNDPGAALAFPGTRAVAGYYVNPYTGEAKQPASIGLGAFMQRMLEWHRYLGFNGTESRPRGKWINGACNLAFCLLAITGLYIWMPRTWSLRGVKAVAVLNWRLAGKARDFNWHNAIGVWSAPILIVLTLTAVPISFQWGGRLINTLTGTPQTATPPPPAAALPAIEIPAPSPGAALLSQDALVAAVQQAIPNWKTITLRVAGAPAPAATGGRSGAGGGAATKAKGGASPSTRKAASPPSEGAGSGSETVRTEIRAARPQATAFTVRVAGTWPRTANTIVAVNPYTGEIVRSTGYAELPAPQRVRAWTRFLHTGEALGWAGQFIAGLACAGGCVLVWTGLALAWRRFFGKPVVE